MNRDLTKLNGAVFERKIKLGAIDTERKTVEASLSSETPVPRWYGNEILVHDSSAIDMTRATDGLPLLWNHDGGSPIGIVENVRIDNGKLRGTLKFSNNPKAREVFDDVSGGFLRNISIGYQVNRWEEIANSNDVRVTNWVLLETSVVSVPADATVGIGRSLTLTHCRETETMTDEINEGGKAADVVVEMKRQHAIAKKAGAVEAVKAERARVTEIHELFDLAAIPRNDFYQGLRARAVDEGWSVDGARKIVMEALSGEVEPTIDYSADVRVAVNDGRLPPVVVPQKPGNSHRGLGVVVTEDALDKFIRGAEEGLMVRACVMTDKESVRKAREGGFHGKSLRTLAGDYLRLKGENTNSLSDDDVATRAIMASRASGQTTSDFTYLLANVANKSLLMGFEEAPETWATWTRRGQLPDFKTADRINMSGFTGLSEVAEDGEITYGKFTDRKETIKLVQYAKKYRMSRQLIINDDLNGLTQVPRLMGRAANRKIGDVVYALLDGTGPTLTQDSTALWNTATHKNYVAAATAPTVATLQTATAAMAKQTDPNTGAVLNIRPKYLVVPVALESTARVLMAAQYDPAGTAGTLTPNPWSGRFEVVTDARLDGQTNGTTAWYLFADPNMFDTFEVAFLNGVSEPYLRENQAWDNQGVEYVVGIDFGVSALDFRAVHKYKGNT